MCACHGEKWSERFANARANNCNLYFNEKCGCRQCAHTFLNEPFFAWVCALANARVARKRVPNLHFLYTQLRITAKKIKPPNSVRISPQRASRHSQVSEQLAKALKSALIFIHNHSFVSKRHFLILLDPVSIVPIFSFVARFWFKYNYAVICIYILFLII